MKLQSGNILMAYLVRMCDCGKQTNNFRTEMLKSAHSSQRLLSIFLYCVAQGLGKNCPLLMLICTLYCQVLFYCHSICTAITMGHVQLSDCHICLKQGCLWNRNQYQVEFYNKLFCTRLVYARLSCTVAVAAVIDKS